MCNVFAIVLYAKLKIICIKLFIEKKVIKNDLISLPTIDGEIDYNTIDSFIFAIQKLVIKDVVDYTDKKSNATKVKVDNG